MARIIAGITSSHVPAIGAVGISGDASDKDEYAAITGVHRAGLKSHPEQPAPNWRDAGL